MIAANVQAAVALRLAKARSLYRVHGQPEEKRVTELQKVMNAMQIGATFSEQPTPREFRQLVERLAARPDGALLEGLVIRSLAQAVYQQTNIGHFGLALDEYAHFTSPIRRYPDLLVHRAIKGAVVPQSASGYRYSANELQTLGTESSQRERRADEAARDVMSYLKCLYMQPRVGETLRGHDLERARVRAVRAAQGNAHRRPDPHLEHSGRLLGARERRHGFGGAAYRPALADGRHRAGALEPGGSYAASDRFRSPRCERRRVSRHRAGGATGSRRLRGPARQSAATRRGLRRQAAQPRRSWLSTNEISSTDCTPSAR